MNPADGLTDPEIADLLARTRRIAVLGASGRPERPSWSVARFLVQHGYTVVPVNPSLAGQSLHGQTVVDTLEQAGPLDMVDLFRSLELIPAAVEEAIRLGARSVWMQLGLVDHASADLARRAGLTVVMDRCPAIELPRLHGPPS
jgi:predicted CoA-binding protein